MTIGQSKKGSLIESLINIAIGCGVALLSQVVIFPQYGIHVPLRTDVQIMLWFTLISLVRSYWLRRLFNRHAVQGTAPNSREQQLLIALGKFAAGYRPGGEGWSREDQDALDMASGVRSPANGLPFVPQETDTGIPAERIARLTIAAWSDCGTRTAIEIAAKEAYAAGRSSAGNK